MLKFNLNLYVIRYQFKHILDYFEAFKWLITCFIYFFPFNFEFKSLNILAKFIFFSLNILKEREPNFIYTRKIIHLI